MSLVALHWSQGRCCRGCHLRFLFSCCCRNSLCHLAPQRNAMRCYSRSQTTRVMFKSEHFPRTRKNRVENSSIFIIRLFFCISRLPSARIFCNTYSNMLESITWMKVVGFRYIISAPMPPSTRQHIETYSRSTNVNLNNKKWFAKSSTQEIIPF